jgi:RimJ/RimL family protein N-acetyltransferase
MQRDPDVMADLGGPSDENVSREKFERYSDAWKVNGISRWAVVDQPSGNFLGYAGVMFRADAEHPLGSHYEIGWRFCRNAWGRGLATESARQALGHAWSTINATEIVSYTAPDNIRSQNVMQRLGLRRDPDRDFTARYPKGDWTGLMWVADHPHAARG